MGTGGMMHIQKQGLPGFFTGQVELSRFDICAPLHFIPPSVRLAPPPPPSPQLVPPNTRSYDSDPTIIHVSGLSQMYEPISDKVRQKKNP